MNSKQQRAIEELMANHGICTLATIRPDGYPQATIVAFANDALTLYIGCGKRAQKLDNIHECARVSVSIGHDYQDWNQIRGLSLGGVAEEVRDQQELTHAFNLLLHKFPQVSSFGSPSDVMADMAIIRVSPEVISLLDYRKGFGHSELFQVTDKQAGHRHV
ncbi:MAG: pyridoxamine 5'-phosphate oxidase family protein [Pseudomonadota bacterium]